MNITTLIIIGAVSAIIAIAGGYLFYVFTRAKKQTWNAKVYTLSEGSVEIKNKDGTVAYRSKDLKPYTTDILEKIQYRNKEIYRLQKLRTTTSVVDTDSVEIWGNNKIVSVLLHNGVASVLKKGYDSDSGKMMFAPIPYDTQNMIMNEIAVRKARIENEKNMLTAVLPYISVLAGILFLVATTYMQVESMMKQSNLQAEMQDKLLAHERTMAELQRDSVRELSSMMDSISRGTQASMYNLSQAITQFEHNLSVSLNNS